MTSKHDESQAPPDQGPKKNNGERSNGQQNCAVVEDHYKNILNSVEQMRQNHAKLEAENQSLKQDVKLLSDINSGLSAELTEANQKINENRKTMQKNLDEKDKKIKNLEKEANEKQSWKDKAQSAQKELKAVKTQVENMRSIIKQLAPIFGNVQESMILATTIINAPETLYKPEAGLNQRKRAQMNDDESSSSSKSTRKEETLAS